MSRPNVVPGDPSHVSVDAGRLWTGGLATACVAALTAWVGVLLAQGVLDVSLAKTAVVLGVSDSLGLNYAVTAFLAALAATGLAHLLSVTTPRPRSFFSWIVGLVTAAAMILPFTRDGATASRVAASIINLVIGVCIGSLLTAVLSRTVVDPERSWQRR
ncbi:hypothetical protein FHX52_0858 [Humibacillus xanthopallidus]|uniref:Uncharacterized protein n=1 Tax=Humibacillus xanthopallidus TaxID=412689 RepID=A0A543PUJ8_9MICO|nr:DUF6069 family protein [Humibacillus xanthopallidus]TQN47743.1 hypothetical protein FHX52_0858 [Humibacillus xanthopallidus]